uniref:Leptin B1 n=1 Tax=Salmo trutta TaxID=8032 RepID=M9PTL7_SALTR|nr:leptin B1 [Salmo trutta]
MHVSVVLLCLGLVVSVSVCHPQRGRPLNGDVQMRNNIKLLSMITVVHIKNYLTEFDVSLEMEFNPMNPPIEGPASIWVHLGGLEESLQDSRRGQVYEDLSSMRGWVHSLSQALGCPDLAKPGGEALKTVYQSLVEGQRYTEKISLNLDKLKIC